MRKGYDGLSGLVRNELGADPMNGDVYIFFNDTRRSVKMLVWDRDGTISPTHHPKEYALFFFK